MNRFEPAFIATPPEDDERMRTEHEQMRLLLDRIREEIDSESEEWRDIDSHVLFETGVICDWANSIDDLITDMEGSNGSP